MKRVLIAGLALVLAISTVGCAGKTENTNQLEESDSKVTSETDVVESKSEKEKSTDDQIVDENELKIRVNKKTESEEFNIRTAEDEENELTPTQLNSINMINYMTVLTQQINESKGDQLFLESARSTLYNETNLNAVDRETQDQITKLADVINNYRMIDVKRERLEYINEQNRAQALSQAIPNPIGLLSAVESGSLLKAAASVVYMAVDATASYSAAVNQAEQEYLKEGWELDDEEMKSLQDSTTGLFNYMCNMVRNYELPDEYVVREDDITEFVKWTKNSNLTSRISWFEDNEKTYSKFRPYWIELVKDYYESGDYGKCIDAAHRYESISTKIIRKDLEYAKMLPMVIVASKETMTTDEYVNTAKIYCEIICENTEDTDWSLRYFAAQTYMDLYALTSDKTYLENAYEIAYYNVNILVNDQKEINATYLNPVKKVKAEKDATKREKKEVKQYNALIKKERKVALPPVNEALYLNCDLLFSLGDELNIDDKEKERIDAILHDKEDVLFLTEVLDNRFTYSKKSQDSNLNEKEIEFDGKKLIIPAYYITERSEVTVTVSGKMVIKF